MFLYAWAIIAHWGFWCGDSLCLIVISICDIGMLMILIDYALAMIILLTLTCTFFLLLISFILTWLILLVVYYLDYHGACYPCLIFISIIILLPSLCVDMSDIHVLCMTICCMTFLLPCGCMSCLSMWDAHLSPYLQVPSLNWPCFPWSHIWYETYCFVCSLTELMIRSRV